MMPLTIQIAINNNEDVIENTIQSILPLNCHVFIADIGCQDNTIKICKSYNLNPIKVSLDQNWSKLRNNITNLSKTYWQMFVEPGEVILTGMEEIEKIVKTNNENAYYGQIINEDIILKHTRIWNKSHKFINCMFEKIESKNEEYIDYLIWSGNQIDVKRKINLWKKIEPNSIEIYYYEACECLKDKNFQEFIRLSEYYIFNEKKDIISVCMMKYYQAVVHILNGDLEQAIKLLIICLSQNSLMAEFWCLLGDVFYQAKEIQKAAIFYQNAIDLGSKRLKSDKFPMQISKYEEYPNKILNHI